MPTIPHGCSSGDSLFSASSGGRLGTPPEISSAASSADENDDEKSRFIERNLFKVFLAEFNGFLLRILFTFSSLKLILLNERRGEKKSPIVVAKLLIANGE